MAELRCATCGGPMVQKSRLRLFAVGTVMVASLAIAWLIPYFLPVAIILFLTGLYLMTWATLGKGCWCRECKNFSVILSDRA